MKFFSQYCCKKGQASVEYILMLVVIIAVISSVFAIVKKNLIGDGKGCSGPTNSKAFYCKFKDIYEIKDFKYFTVRR